MARTGLNSSAHLTTISTGDARSNESTQWNLSRAGHLARINHGSLVGSSWGMSLSTRALPICGTETEATYEQGYTTIVHTATFDQINLSTAGAGTSSDKYILHCRFALGNLMTHGIGLGASSGTGNIGGKIEIKLVNSGGSQVLYSAHSSLMTGASSSNSLTPTPGTIGHYEISKEDTIIAGLLPAPNTTLDSQIVVTLSDLIESSSIGTPTSDFTMNTFPNNRDYIGVFGYSLRIFNNG